MKIFLKLSVLILLTVSVNSFAQNDSLKIQKMQELESVFKEKIISNLNIDESAADKLMEMDKENRKQLKSIHKEKKEIFKSIEEDPGASDIESKLNKIIQLERKTVDQKESYFNELKTFLTPQQIAKSFSMKNKFYKELRKEIKKRGKRDMKD